jgi:hypothetical protein
MPDDIENAPNMPWRITPDPQTGLTSLEFQFGDDILVAVLSADELAGAQRIFAHIAEHIERRQPARIDLRAAFLDTIGRDPFEKQL